MVAVNMAKQMINAPIRVNRPNKISRPPTNSPSASAANHSHAGRSGNGASRVSVIHFNKPGPANVPNTFWEPCAIKTVPTASRSGNVDQAAEVAMSFFSMIFIRLFREASLVFCSDYEPRIRKKNRISVNEPLETGERAAFDSASPAEPWFMKQSPR